MAAQVASPERPNVYIAADADGYREQSDLDQAATLLDLLEIVEGAMTAAGLDRPTWRPQPGGGAFARLDPEERVADGFVSALDAELFHYNLSRRPCSRMRLRVEVHSGRLCVHAQPESGGVVENQAERMA